MLQKEETRTYW